MIHGIELMAKDNLITEEERQSVIFAAAKGTLDHTIGYEMEVLDSALPFVPKVPLNPKASAIVQQCRDELGRFGYIVDSETDQEGVSQNGTYELRSPAATHPLALSIATRGIQRYGWIPASSRGAVTAHISIGTIENQDVIESQSERMITLVRAIELLGGAAPNRLMEPVTGARRRLTKESSCLAWNLKGKVGVETNATRTAETWEGSNRRVEFRSLGYYSPEQFGNTLSHIYYLTRGLLAPPHTYASNTYNDYDRWIRKFFAGHGLSEPPDEVYGFVVHDTDILESYLRPYADLMESDQLEPLQVKTKQSIEALQGLFGMADR